MRTAVWFARLDGSPEAVDRQTACSLLQRVLVETSLVTGTSQKRTILKLPRCVTNIDVEVLCTCTFVDMSEVPLEEVASSRDDQTSCRGHSGKALTVEVKVIQWSRNQRSMMVSSVEDDS